MLPHSRFILIGVQSGDHIYTNWNSRNSQEEFLTSIEWLTTKRGLIGCYGLQKCQVQKCC